MKKRVLVVLLGLMLAAGAFADHPKGWGLGLVGQYGDYWSGGGGALGGWAVSLKVPSVPVFWGINMSISSNGFNLGATGDYYIIDQTLIKEAGLGWFLGIGGYFDFGTYTYRYVTTDYTRTALGLGARVPIGLSWQPINVLEVFIDFAPSLGIIFYSGDYYDYSTNKNESRSRLGGGWQGDIGIRFWF
ncbi:MAG: DUF3996 domain-containing protein [Treponema sp.]|jgi:hypothetical protein|nr:DUF3996 domain-containing protein [Treponema sp.]